MVSKCLHNWQTALYPFPNVSLPVFQNGWYVQCDLCNCYAFQNAKWIDDYEAPEGDPVLINLPTDLPTNDLTDTAAYCDRPQDIDCCCTDEITCPYCGSEISDCWELNVSGTETTVECENEHCGKAFLVSSTTTITYSSRKKR